MTRLLPPLHEGHAPIFLHQAFDDAVEAYEKWTLEMHEPMVELDGAYVPISAVFGRMRSCTDILPMRTLEATLAVVGDRSADIEDRQATYAQAAFVMRALCVERLRAA